MVLLGMNQFCIYSSIYPKIVSIKLVSEMFFDLLITSDSLIDELTKMFIFCVGGSHGFELH